jgi:protein-S-isoprenylcysteine O-methyltransferase Ste14
VGGLVPVGLGLLEPHAPTAPSSPTRGAHYRGPYAVVRHPLYSAYIIGGIGFLMQSFSLGNAILDVIAVG